MKIRRASSFHIALLCALVATPVASTGFAAPSRIHAVCARSTGSMQQLAEVDNTRDGNFHCLGLSFIGDRVTALRVETHSFNALYRRVAEDVRVAEFPVAQIESSRGAVLDGEPGHDAIIVQGHFTAGGAELVTRFLYDGFTGEYRSCAMRIGRDGAGWHLINRDNETVSQILVRTRQIPLLGTIGIADLEGACSVLRG